VGQTKTTIELNGKLYDATTGAMITQKVAATTKAIKGKVVDGFYRLPTSQSVVTVVKKPVPVPAAKHRSTEVAPKAGHKPEKSQTLMRHAVHKPTAAPVTVAQKTSPTVKKPLNERELRAAQTTKSAKISRFSNLTAPARTSLSTKIAPLAVRPHPDVRAVSKKVAAVATRHSTEDTFTQALRTATSHEQKSPAYHKRKLRHRAGNKIGLSNRAVNVISVFLVIVVLGAFVTYQNAARISMNLAASRAGFSASMPGYTPSGFGLNNAIKATPGMVTVSFHSHSDDRSFTLTQKTSNWTSSSLLSSVVAVNNQSYQTVEDKGKTIYLYNDGQATWVDGGVWYQISGNAQLGNDQLVHIADSL